MESWREVRSGYEWDFPQEHWARRDYRTEWWYFTGHLETVGDKKRSFGYQFTFFRIGVVPGQLPLQSDWASGNLIMGHAAISDLDEEKHRFSETLFREAPFLGGFSAYPEPVIARSLAPPGTEGEWSLVWNGEAFDLLATDKSQGFSLQLSTEPLKPLVLQGPGGLSPKSQDGESASLYYSYTRLATRGTAEVDGVSYPVTGESWMDKEFSSNILSDDQVGWDWMSLQFRDGRDLMLFRLRNRRGETDFSWATLVSAEGKPSYFQGQDWSLNAVDWWDSPSGATYPSRWTLEMPDMAPIELFSAFPDQENRSQLIPGLNYWEGVVLATSDGEPCGRGYAELTGYDPEGRLPL
jgi:predicted secreted hydrolase